jgi:hypothetical protein
MLMLWRRRLRHSLTDRRGGFGQFLVHDQFHPTLERVGGKSSGAQLVRAVLERRQRVPLVGVDVATPFAHTIEGRRGDVFWAHSVGDESREVCEERFQVIIIIIIITGSGGGGGRQRG